MQTIVYSEYGSPEVLRLVDREPAAPGPGEVRVRVVRSAVNPGDNMSRSGAYGIPLPFPEVVPNEDGSGVVDAVGPGVDSLAAGDRVWMTLATTGRPTGTAQEFTVLPAAKVFPLPAAASFDLGADLGVPAVTAHRALTVSEGGPGRLTPGALAGRTVLVQGGAGAVGNAAIQLATWAGAQVIASVSSPAKAQLARAAGAHHVVNYKDGGLTEQVRAVAPQGADLIVEVAPAVNLDSDLTIIKPRGTISMYAFNGGSKVSLDLFQTISSNSRFQWVLIPATGTEELTAAAEDINAAVTAGAFDVGEERGLPVLHYPFRQAAAAQAAVAAGAVGKVVLDVGEA
jgi:NADPH2:quinone reductase